MKQDRRVPQKLFPSNTEHCPVKLFELLISKRPADLRIHGPLYLTPLRKPYRCVWYSVQPVGESKIMKTMASLAGIDKSGKRYTNHSVRKTTTVWKLQKARVSNDKIAAITGHKSEQILTLQDYATTDMEDHQKISKILSSKKSDVVAVQPARKVLQPLSQQSAGLPSAISQCPPQLVFNNCAVYTSTSNCLSSNTTMEVHGRVQPSRKRVRIQNSDEED